MVGVVVILAEGEDFERAPKILRLYFSELRVALLAVAMIFARQPSPSMCSPANSSSGYTL